MRRTRLEMGGAATLVLLASAAIAGTDELADWHHERAGKMALYHAAHPQLAAELATIKERTAALIAAHRPSATGAALDQPPVIWRTTDATVVIFDDPAAPPLIAIPAGEFTMGEAGAGPRRRVRIAYALGVSRSPVTWGEYAHFVAETGHISGTSCDSAAPPSHDWRDPGFAQTPRSPATCLRYSDATTYAQWLSHKTGQRYRLLSEAEYEYANRAGSTGAYWWGDDGDGAAACAHANGLDLDARWHAQPAGACHDGYAYTAPVGMLKANAFGLFDTSGNVQSWTLDCWNLSLAGMPGDGAPNLAGDCSRHALRGGSWSGAGLRAADREPGIAEAASADHGFRVAREL